eukprot:5427375-Prymnesium_polylepis.1
MMSPWLAEPEDKLGIPPGMAACYRLSMLDNSIPLCTVPFLVAGYESFASLTWLLPCPCAIGDGASGTMDVAQSSAISNVIRSQCAKR